MRGAPQAWARSSLSRGRDRGDARRIHESGGGRRPRGQAAGRRAAIDTQEIVRGPCGSSESYAARNSSPTEGIRDISQLLLSFAATAPGERPKYSIGAEKSAESEITALFP